MKHRQFLFVVLIALLAALPVAVFAQEEVELGETFEGELSEDTPAVELTFEGEEGQLVIITQTAEDFDSYLTLLGPSGDVIAQNDDGAGNYNSLIGPLSLPESGEYTLVAESYGNHSDSATLTAEGDFTVSLTEASVRRVEFTQEIKAELTDSDQTDYYSFTGGAGDLVDIVVTADQGNVVVALMSGSTSLMSADTTYTETSTAIISGYALPDTGEYLISVRSPAGDETEYSLSLDRVEIEDLAYGDSVDLAFDEETISNIFQFEGEAGDVVDAIVDSGAELDTKLTINGPDGFQVAYADDVNDVDPAIYDLILAQTGIYTVLVETYRPGEGGTATLSLDLTELATLDDGPQTLNMSSTDNVDTLRFTGEANQSVRLVVEVTKGGPASPYVRVTDENELWIAEGSASGVMRLALDFTLNADGEAYVRIDDTSYSDLSLLVSLEEGIVVAEEDTSATTAPEATIEADDADVVEPTAIAPEATVEPTEEADISIVEIIPVEATAEATEAAVTIVEIEPVGATEEADTTVVEIEPVEATAEATEAAS